MQIQWLRTNQELQASGISKIYYRHPLFNNEGKTSDKPVCLVFNDIAQLEDFLAASQSFEFASNKIRLIFGLIDKQADANKKENYAQLDTSESVIFFGNTAQENKFNKIFNSSSAFISNKCVEKHRTIAYQRHLSNTIHHQSVSLGEFRSDFGRAESYLRAAKAIFFNLNSVRIQDSDYADSYITGLDIYEACQIIRFCGMSTDHSFMFLNVSDSKTGSNSWNCVATMIWYYLEGKNQMTIDHPEHTENQVYMVEHELFNEAISFIKAHQTKRWWFVHPETKEKIPCSENDYNALKNGSIPELLLNLFVS